MCRKKKGMYLMGIVFLLFLVITLPVKAEEPIYMQNYSTLRGATASISDLKFSPDSRQLVAVDENGKIYFWQSLTTTQPKVWEGHIGKVNEVLFYLDGQVPIFFTAGADYKIKSWYPGWDQPVRTLTAHRGSVNSMIILDTKTLISGGEDKKVVFWDLHQYTPFASIEVESPVKALAYNTGNGEIAVGLESGMIYIYDSKNRLKIKEISNVIPVGSAIKKLVFSPDGKNLICGATGLKQPIILDVQQNYGVVSLQRSDFFDDFYNSSLDNWKNIRFNSKGNLLFSIGQTNLPTRKDGFYVYSFTSKKLMAKSSEAQKNVTAIDTSLDEKYFASAEGQEVIIYDASSVTIKNLSSIFISPMSLTINEGQVRSLTVAAYYDDKTNKILDNREVLWTSSNSNIVRVINGVLTAIEEGSAVITASYQGQSRSINVSVIGQYRILPSQYNVPSNKIWTVKFNNSVLRESINTESIYIKDELGNKVSGLTFSLSGDEKSVLIYPPSSGYQSKKTYVIYVRPYVRGKNGRLLAEPVKMVFTVQ